jgi:uncharacterized protein
VTSRLTRPQVETLSIPMSDGVSLAALRYPAGTGPAPAILRLTPYGKDQAVDPIVDIARDLRSDVIVADVRGLGASGGAWNGPLAPREIQDGVEVAEWVAAHSAMAEQPW